ncbi:MAG: histidine phosphatase family protein [Chloroflexota bacterium]
MRLILVRHGQTQWNLERRVQGGGSDVELNELGRHQAHTAGLALKDEKIDAIYSSPLRRARDTAREIARHHRRRVRVEPGFIEMDAGDLDGLAFERLPQVHPAFWKEWREGNGSIAWPGGESLEQMMERTWAAVERLRARHPKGTVVVAAHTFVVLCLMLKALDMPPGLFRRLRLEVGSITVLDLDGDRARLVKFNDTCHWKEV